MCLIGQFSFLSCLFTPIKKGDEGKRLYILSYKGFRNLWNIHTRIERGEGGKRSLLPSPSIGLR